MDVTNFRSTLTVNVVAILRFITFLLRFSKPSSSFLALLSFSHFLIILSCPRCALGCVIPNCDKRLLRDCWNVSSNGKFSRKCESHFQYSWRSAHGTQLHQNRSNHYLNPQNRHIYSIDGDGNLDNNDWYDDSSQIMRTIIPFLFSSTSSSPTKLASVFQPRSFWSSQLLKPHRPLETFLPSQSSSVAKKSRMSGVVFENLRDENSSFAHLLPRYVPSRKEFLPFSSPSAARSIPISSTVSPSSTLPAGSSSSQQQSPIAEHKKGSEKSKKKDHNASLESNAHFSRIYQKRIDDSKKKKSNSGKVSRSVTKSRKDEINDHVASDGSDITNILPFGSMRPWSLNGRELPEYPLKFRPGSVQESSTLMTTSYQSTPFLSPTVSFSSNHPSWMKSSYTTSSSFVDGEDDLCSTKLPDLSCSPRNLFRFNFHRTPGVSGNDMNEDDFLDIDPIWQSYLPSREKVEELPPLRYVDSPSNVSPPSFPWLQNKLSPNDGFRDKATKSSPFVPIAESPSFISLLSHYSGADLESSSLSSKNSSSLSETSSPSPSLSLPLLLLNGTSVDSSFIDEYEEKWRMLTEYENIRDKEGFLTLSDWSKKIGKSEEELKNLIISCHTTRLLLPPEVKDMRRRKKEKKKQMKKDEEMQKVKELVELENAIIQLEKEDSLGRPPLIEEWAWATGHPSIHSLASHFSDGLMNLEKFTQRHSSIVVKVAKKYASNENRSTIRKGRGRLKNENSSGSGESNDFSNDNAFVSLDNDDDDDGGDDFYDSDGGDDNVGSETIVGPSADPYGQSTQEKRQARKSKNLGPSFSVSASNADRSQKARSFSSFASSALPCSSLEDLMLVGLQGVKRGMKRFALQISGSQLSPSSRSSHPSSPNSDNRYGNTSAVAWVWCKGAILSHLQKYRSSLTFPLSWWAELAKGKKAENQLATKLGRNPTDDEIAKKIKVSPHRWQAILAATRTPVNTSKELMGGLSKGGGKISSHDGGGRPRDTVGDLLISRDEVRRSEMRQYGGKGLVGDLMKILAKEAPTSVAELESAPASSSSSGTGLSLPRTSSKCTWDDFEGGCEGKKNTTEHHHENDNGDIDGNRIDIDDKETSHAGHGGKDSISGKRSEDSLIVDVEKSGTNCRYRGARKIKKKGQVNETKSKRLKLTMTSHNDIFVERLVNRDRDVGKAGNGAKGGNDVVADCGDQRYLVDDEATGDGDSGESGRKTDAQIFLDKDELKVLAEVAETFRSERSDHKSHTEHQLQDSHLSRDPRIRNCDLVHRSSHEDIKKVTSHRATKRHGTKADQRGEGAETELRQESGSGLIRKKATTDEERRNGGTDGENEGSSRWKQTHKQVEGCVPHKGSILKKKKPKLQMNSPPTPSPSTHSSLPQKSAGVDGSLSAERLLELQEVLEAAMAVPSVTDDLW